MNLRALLLTSPLGQFIRYYQAALINTIFGFSLYALLVFFGVNRFFAQIISHVIGMCFNYFTYSRHVFRESKGSKLRFVLSYAVSGGLNFGFLYLWSLAFSSAYVAGILSTVTASLIMFFLLKYVVFVNKKLA